MSHPTRAGVDDFALRKGRTYGTLLVDLERRRPIDLLPDRTADTLAAWLHAHPGVEMITRDSSTEYARGGTLGAPLATQVVDRWHLLVNRRQALERLLERLHARLPRLPARDTVPQMRGRPARGSIRGPLRSPSQTEHAASREARARRDARYQEVPALTAAGVPLLQIAMRLGMSRTTARLFARAESFPERAARRPDTDLLRPHLDYLQRRWEEGCHTSSQLWREIRAQGYPGSRKQVARWAQQRRQVPAPTTPHKYVAALPNPASPLPISQTEGRHGLTLDAPRHLVWLFLCDPSGLDAEDAALLAHISQDADVVRAHALARQFQHLVRQRTPEGLNAWLSACTASNLAELRTFAAGVQHDHAAIQAALTEPWSNGPVEGQITRVKFLKRQMFGRAKLDLLRRRVLPAA